MEIKLTIDRIEGGQAVLKTTDNETINWPLNKLPVDIKEGMIISFCVAKPNEDAEKTDKNLAKDILNEILNTEN